MIAVEVPSCFSMDTAQVPWFERLVVDLVGLVRTRGWGRLGSIVVVMEDDLDRAGGMEARIWCILMDPRTLRLIHQM